MVGLAENLEIVGIDVTILSSSDADSAGEDVSEDENEPEYENVPEEKGEREHRRDPAAAKDKTELGKTVVQ